MVCLIPESAISALDQRFGKAMAAGLAANALQALATIEIEGSTTNTRLQELIDCHSSAVFSIILNTPGTPHIWKHTARVAEISSNLPSLLKRSPRLGKFHLT